MNRTRRFELWISGILVVVCLLLLNVLVWQFRKEPTLRLVGVDLARFVSLGEHPPASSREQHEPSRAEAAVSSTAATMSRLDPLAQAARHPFESEPAKRPVSMPPPRRIHGRSLHPSPKRSRWNLLAMLRKPMAVSRRSSLWGGASRLCMRARSLKSISGSRGSLPPLWSL